MNRLAVLCVASIFALSLFSAVSYVNAYTSWQELSREDQVSRASIYTIVNWHAGREVVFHPDLGFEIPLGLALMSDPNG